MKPANLRLNTYALMLKRTIDCCERTVRNSDLVRCLYNKCLRVQMFCQRIANARPHHPSTSSQMASSSALPFLHHKTNTVVSFHQ